MKIIYCQGCNVKVAKIEAGSKIKSKAVMLCDDCETKRKALELRYRSQGTRGTGSINPYQSNNARYKSMNEFMELFNIR